MHSLGRIADELEHRDATTSDVTAIDSTLSGLQRCLIELRLVLAPPPESA
jgi:hypothetical protein